jgi:saccharopine dehydrogenase-like NADP-dependent oxidoreductase
MIAAFVRVASLLAPYRIVVVGGYGHFGARIVRALSRDPDIRVVVAGRRPPSADVETLALDHEAPDFPARLRDAAPDLVIHTSGPFQGQDYHVARAAIAAGAHCLDLADGRAFVCGIGALDADAKSRGVVVASGASTLPAVSSAVLDSLAPHYATIETIDIVIAPAQRTPRGRATLEAVLSYCGRPFRAWEDGAWRDVHGWQDLRRVSLDALGTRIAARCDVPDLELWPARYPGVRSVRFDAALALPVEHAALAALAGLVRIGLVRAPERFAPAAIALARHLDRFGGDVGGMRVRVEGARRDGTRGAHVWSLVAQNGHGPEIPCIPAVAIARKLARGGTFPAGARPCTGMMSLDDFDATAAPFDIAWRVDER